MPRWEIIPLPSRSYLIPPLIQTSFRSFNLRLVLACVLALAVSFPTGVISLGKALALVGTLGLLLMQAWRGRTSGAEVKSSAMDWTSVAVLIALAAMALSVSWTTAPLDEAVHAWVKHAKLALVPALLLLLRTRREAVVAVGVFLAGQFGVLVISCLQGFLHVVMPFRTQATPGRDFLVFAGHLDQPIMTSIATALFWHLRAHFMADARKAQTVALAVVVLAAINVLVVQFGRTGHLVAISLTAAAVFWAIPRRFKLLAVLSPIVVAGAVAAGSSQVQQRMALVWQETGSYTQSGNIESSSGERLNYWRRSLQAIAERPVAGFGVGSWNMQYNRMEGGKGRFHTYQIRNPHQEFLLWMVEMGAIGLALLVGVFAAAARDARQMRTPGRRAVASVLIAMAVSCIFNSALYDAQIGDYLCVALGLAMAIGWRTRDESA